VVSSGFGAIEQFRACKLFHDPLDLPRRAIVIEINMSRFDAAFQPISGPVFSDTVIGGKTPVVPPTVTPQGQTVKVVPEKAAYGADKKPGRPEKWAPRPLTEYDRACGEELRERYCTDLQHAEYFQKKYESFCDQNKIKYGEGLILAIPNSRIDANFPSEKSLQRDRMSSVVPLRSTSGAKTKNRTMASDSGPRSVAANVAATRGRTRKGMVRRT
jgi:hypothetical protein